MSKQTSFLAVYKNDQQVYGQIKLIEIGERDQIYLSSESSEPPKSQDLTNEKSIKEIGFQILEKSSQRNYSSSRQIIKKRLKDSPNRFKLADFYSKYKTSSDSQQSQSPQKVEEIGLGSRYRKKKSKRQISKDSSEVFLTNLSPLRLSPRILSPQSKQEKMFQRFRSQFTSKVQNQYQNQSIFTQKHQKSNEMIKQIANIEKELENLEKGKIQSRWQNYYEQSSEEIDEDIEQDSDLEEENNDYDKQNQLSGTALISLRAKSNLQYSNIMNTASKDEKYMSRQYQGGHLARQQLISKISKQSQNIYQQKPFRLEIGSSQRRMSVHFAHKRDSKIQSTKDQHNLKSGKILDNKKQDREQFALGDFIKRLRTIGFYKTIEIIQSFIKEQIYLFFEIIREILNHLVQQITKQENYDQIWTTILAIYILQKIGKKKKMEWVLIFKKLQRLPMQLEISILGIQKKINFTNK
ncbi:UNKNOWN [Stylonychia lemnae]|uniref:Uncharacterized protein n=1 Tax=Stylonychia lemnae TaxID=5949 RepID=A0A078BB36_STYLE|nr:UNKNOWN [Stylonychia lemnae]|eukprot:CDW91785.1 UNKNOWN [Stylonychia lemnae]